MHFKHCMLSQIKSPGELLSEMMIKTTSDFRGGWTIEKLLFSDKIRKPHKTSSIACYLYLKPIFSVQLSNLSLIDKICFNQLSNILLINKIGFTNSVK